jgi:hypothetical protein
MEASGQLPESYQELSNRPDKICGLPANKGSGNFYLLSNSERILMCFSAGLNVGSVIYDGNMRIVVVNNMFKS